MPLPTRFPGWAMKLTKANVDRLKLPPGKAEMIVFDDALPGFGLRIRAGGKRTWVAQYRFGVKQRRVTLASVNTCDADDARERAKDALAQAQLGQDPQALKIAARAPKARELTIGELVELYLPTAERKLMQSDNYGGRLSTIKLAKLGERRVARRKLRA